MLFRSLVDSTSLGAVTTTRDYNAFGELRLATATVTGPGEIYAEDLSRDALGRITTKVETVLGVPTTTEYSYDLAGRLDTVSVNGALVRDYSYDANGNRLSSVPMGPVVGVYDDQDRLLEDDRHSYTYTANGELLSREETASRQTTSYAYDVLGNLVSVGLPDGRQITYVIDGANRRVGKGVDGVLVQGFLYRDALNPVAELDGAGNVVSRFVYGSKPNVPDYMLRGGNTYRILSDHLGSVRLVVNTSSGAVAQRIDYDEFGNITTDTNPGFQPFGFADRKSTR